MLVHLRHSQLRCPLLFTMPAVVIADNCFTNGETAGIIFGAIFGTFLICLGFGSAILYLMHRYRKAEKIKVFERIHATQETDSHLSSMEEAKPTQMKEASTDAYRISVRHKETEVAMPTPLPRRRGSHPDSPKRSRSLEPVESDEEKRRQKLELTLSRFGFSIDDDDRAGIFVDKVMPGTPAELSGNIFTGDRIKTLTISFDDMSYDDALAILSLVSDYTIRLDLERVTHADETTQTDMEPVMAEMRVSVPFRSTSMKNVRRRLESCPHRHCESLETLQAPALPATKEPPSPVQKAFGNQPLPGCKCTFEEQRTVHIVRHTPNRSTGRSPSVSDFSQATSITPGRVPPGHGLIRAIDFEKRIRDAEHLSKSGLKPLSSSSGCSEEEESGTSSECVPALVRKPNARIVSTEASVNVSKRTEIRLESAQVPLPTPPPVLATPSTVPSSASSPSPVPQPAPVEANRQLVVRAPSPTSSTTSAESGIASPPRQSEEPLTVEVASDDMQLALSTPHVHPAALTPDFVEMRARKFSQRTDDEIVDRKLPSLPVPRKKSEDPQDAGQMYLRIRSNLKEVYTAPGNSDIGSGKKSSLSEEQYNTLETNRRRLEHEKEQLRQLGIM